MTVIVYSSSSGSSRRYAEALSSRVGLPVYPVGSQPVGEPVVFVGWLRMDKVVGLSRVPKGDVIAVCTVGLDPGLDRARVAERNGIRVPMYYLRGWVDRSKLGMLDKAILTWVSAMMKLRGLDPVTEPIFRAMMEGGGFYDDAYLDQVETFVRSRGRW